MEAILIRSVQQVNIPSRLIPHWVDQQKQDYLPAWLGKCVREAVECGQLPVANHRLTGSWYALHHATKCLGADWVDMPGRLSLEDGSELLVSEPRVLTDVGIEQLMEFCSVLGLGFKILPLSYCNPGRRIRIIVWGWGVST